MPIDPSHSRGATAQRPRAGQRPVRPAAGPARAVAPAWLHIGGPLRSGEIPWFWSWEDRETAALCARTGRPFVAGPNILFADSRHPCRIEAEREICQRGKLPAAVHRVGLVSGADRAAPRPGQPRTDRGVAVPDRPPAGRPAGGRVRPAGLREVGRVPRQRSSGLPRLWPRHVRVRYGRYRREKFFEAARSVAMLPVLLRRRSRAAGPGRDSCWRVVLPWACPRVAPFVEHGRTGILLDRFEPEACRRAVAQCHQFDRQAVAAQACRQFDTPALWRPSSSRWKNRCNRYNRTADSSYMRPGALF